MRARPGFVRNTDRSHLLPEQLWLGYLNPIAFGILHVAVFRAAVPIRAIPFVLGNIVLAHFAACDIAVLILRHGGNRLSSILEQISDLHDAFFGIWLALSGKGGLALILRS